MGKGTKVVAHEGTGTGIFYKCEYEDGHCSTPHWVPIAIPTKGPRPKVVRSVADITAKVQTLVCYNVEVLPRVFQVPALGIQQLKTLQVGI
ncbi:hypothetical protein MTR_5g006760 [Medicago truncatula]|uniref:Uncharacterized protein n=1 Tax=Medicago truncatula TaxID=3880 RepID=G7K3S0_MEDTR|nr:hypothetical protein MTR_5g006760 [Medicago truncatula]